MYVLICNGLLFDRKAAGFLDSLGQFVVHFLQTFVGRKIKTVEAGVSLGQVLCWRVDQVQGEQSRSRGPRGAL